MMTDWYQRSINALQLNGKGERTQEAYTRAVRMLSTFYSKPPDEITEPELEAYVLRRRNVDHWSPNTMRICYCGIRFFFVHVLQRNWHLFDILRAKSEARLPAILSPEEVRGILRCVRTPRNHAFLSTVYACGLRLQEAQYLEVSDIDSQRLMIHVHRGKGAKDRFVPLPHATLIILRTHWRSHRNPRLLFPACGRDGRSAATATTPMAKSSVQGAFRHAKRAAGVAKRGVSVHTLRHCYATHLLEAGVNPRVIQRHMGHASLESTMLYLHLTHKGTEDAYALIDRVMEGL
jgi:site-specific recombinase XerD